VKSILQNRLTGLYFDGYSFQTSQRASAARIDGALPREAVRMIWGDDVEVIQMPEHAETRYTFDHVSDGMKFVIRATCLTSARKKLGTALCSHFAAETYWLHVKSEVIE
jgi:hypothetical protein